MDRIHYIAIILFLALVLGAMSLVPQHEDFEIAESDFTYVSCIALDHPDPKDDSNKYTVETLKRAPCFSYFIEKVTLAETKSAGIARLKEIAANNNNRLKGPAYFVVGRNRDTKKVNAWVYLPSFDKNGQLVGSEEDYYLYHEWVRKLLMSDTFGTNRWLCYNPCDSDYGLQTTIGYDVSNNFQPMCGCVSSGPCSFYHIPDGVSIKPRDKSKISSYSAYRIESKAFEAYGVTLDPPTRVDMDRFSNGSTMYAGCDNRLLSKDRKHSLEMEPDGLAFYDANSGAIFEDTCSVESGKTQKQKYVVEGKLPRLVNEGDDISIYAIVDNNGKKLLVKQLTATPGGTNPYTLMLDNTGALKAIDSKGIALDVGFVKP